MDLIGHVIDLKLPWLTGFSRSVVTLADAMAASLGLPPNRRATLRRAGWLQGLGRVAIPNSVWGRPGPLSAADWERVRLAPYWTSRAARQVEPLAAEAEMASQVYERLDGSGYFRASAQRGQAIELGILAAAVAWVAMRSDRPWRPALSADAAMAALQDDVKNLRFDAQVIGALASCVSPQHALPATRPDAGAPLTPREIEVLQRISLGDSNKAAAQKLGISPSTVRTHLESAYNKLNCRTRAACVLQASLLGLLG
jgi:HD-GYP domain-containing protein (c-di-GMP phosphodiesterase class II)